MHWDAWLDDGRGELVFGRPIRWLLFLYGERVVPFTIQRGKVARTETVRCVKSGAVTFGHRFFSKTGRPGRPIRVRSFSDYQTSLAANYVLIDREKRRARITQKLDRFASRFGGRVELQGEQAALLNEVPDLIEYPSVVAGNFPSEFLSLPSEVLKTTMIHHQHYFPVIDQQGELTSTFLAVTNTPRDNVVRIARNAERVLVARLRDARFFWNADRKTRLQDQLERLDTLLFHKKLGSYRAKAERVGVLAERIAREVLDSDDVAEAAYTAGKWCKADLATDMVGEFPELQGVMGGVYAKEHGESEEVWRAIYYHYLPVGIESDARPSQSELGRAAVSWAAVSLADKLDTLVGLFHAGERPTGSRDPFGIRRQAQGIVRVLVDLPSLTGLKSRVSIGQLLEMAAANHEKSDQEVLSRETAFVRERTRYVLEERGFDIRNVRSVTHQDSLHDLRPIDALRKLEVMSELTGSKNFQQLAALFKRVRNIAKELSDIDFLAVEAAEGKDEPNSLLTDPAEEALRRELEQRRPIIEKAVESGENFEEALTEASKLGPAVDRFFTEVFVMVDDMRLRRARLYLMKQLERSILQLADVSEIVHAEGASSG
jgi:glycyl-tRNA synthetase beta chain